MQPGALVGPYQIVAPLGAGSMGEVYRARDQRLSRDVALKMLSARRSLDTELARRFDQEARAVAMLSHPNIMGVFDVGVHEATPYVVCELLEGETLRDRLAQGAMPVRRALDVAAQIARGLAAAHDKGIVHRDLKPENVFVTRDGIVKVLDFGLAKLDGTPIPSDLSSKSPTIPIGTQPGTILGTVGYMSPEQVRGQPADPRSDIFSLGVILYELLTGARAFKADTAVETMHAILHGHPPEPPVPLPPGLVALVLRCLEKQPGERFQSARDLAFDLESFSRFSETGSFTPSRPGQRTRSAVLAAAVVPIIIVLGLWGVSANRSQPRLAPAVAKPSPPSLKRITFRRGTMLGARFAPDGQTYVYDAAWEGGTWEVLASRHEAPESRSLQADARLLDVSRSGDLALLLHPRPGTVSLFSRGTLARVALGGGAPRELLDDVQDASFMPDGKELAVIRDASALNTIEYPPGRVIYKPASGFLSHLRVAPTGGRLAVLEHPVPNDDGGSVVTMNLDGSARKVLAEGWSTAFGLAWAPDGSALWITGDRGDGTRALATLDMAGAMTKVIEIPGLVLHDVAPGNRALVTLESTRLGILGQTGSDGERDLGWLDYSYGTDIAADGSRLLLFESGDGVGPEYAVYLRGMDGSPAVRIGDGIAQGLSPDGRHALAIPTTAPPRIVVLPTRTGQTTTIAPDASAVLDATWLPDGKRIMFRAVDAEGAVRLYLKDAFDASPEQRLPPDDLVDEALPTPDGLGYLVHTHDGKVAHHTFAGAPPVPVAGVEPEESLLRFAADGRSFYVSTRWRVPCRITTVDLATGQRRLHRELAPGDPAGVIAIVDVSLTPDGSAYHYTYQRYTSDLYLMSGVSR